jgi:transposase
MRLCEECDRPGMTVSYVARTHGKAPSQLFHWRRRMAEGSREAVEADDEVVSATKVRELEKQVRELQRVLGKKTMENEILREAVRLVHEKKTHLSIAVASLGRFPVKAIADTLEVSRSNLIDQSAGGRAKRSRYSIADDERLTPMIRTFFDERPTYGCRRITALLNRKLQSTGQRRVNTNAFIVSCCTPGCCSNGIRVFAKVAPMTASSERCDRIRVGVPTVRRSHAGTARLCASRLSRTHAIARSSRGPRAPRALAAR